jgi:hypothetical protein
MASLNHQLRVIIHDLHKVLRGRRFSHHPAARPLLLVAIPVAMVVVARIVGVVAMMVVAMMVAVVT